MSPSEWRRVGGVLLAVLVFGLRLLGAQQATVVRDVNLRSTASTAHPPKRLMLPPEVLTLISPNRFNGYYHVRTSQQETGWAWAANIRVDSAATVSGTGGTTTPVAGSYAIDDPSCPAVGSHMVAGVATPWGETTDGGLRNMAKRHIPAAGTPLTLDLFAFHALQDDINSRFADAHDSKTTFEPDRHALTALPTSAGTVGEGDLVQIATYIIAVHGEGAESVNCGGSDGTDIHISLGPRNGTEYKGIVAEMIPQLGHPAGWDVTTLNKIKTAKLQVLVVGGLTYDNEHKVNDDPSHPLSGQPKRISLWEIHPITEFLVCAMASCDPANHAGWQTLTAWAAGH